MAWEDAKRIFERVTRSGRPDRNALKSLMRARKPNVFRFKDDGETPNNPALPLLYYRSPVVLDHSYDSAAIFEELFAANAWGDSASLQ